MEPGETIELHLVEFDGVTHVGWYMEHPYLWTEEDGPHKPDPHFVGDYPKGSRPPKWAILCRGRTDVEYWEDLHVPEIVGTPCPVCAELLGRVVDGDVVYSKLEAVTGREMPGKWVSRGKVADAAEAARVRLYASMLFLVKQKWEAFREKHSGEADNLSRTAR